MAQDERNAIACPSIVARLCGDSPLDAIATEQSLSTSAADELALLIAAMRDGKERALEELYDATVGKLYAVASVILRNAEDAEEVVCSTYSYAWANAARFNAARANALGWLLMLCRSRALDRLRQRRAGGEKIALEEIAEIEASDAPQPEDVLSLLQQRSRIRAALARLSPERRRLVSLAFLRGMSHREIAEATDTALGTVKSHVRRALQELREQLETV